MKALMSMKHAKISGGGQISVPAEIRHRWKTSRVVLEDLGDRIVVRPAADDPIVALRGAFADASKPSSDQLRRRARDEERAAEERRSRR
jgi:bifunctional DNA-binding transcriptional regulator/antitoxin component of YhaV-PrlF toxin-antitoxin module